MNLPVRIGTRESELALWQANKVKELLHQNNILAELVLVRSEGDIDLVTPLYEMGVQGIFTKTLDLALLNNRIDIAVHSMKDVPTIIPKGIEKVAVLERANYKDLFVYRNNDLVKEWKLAGTADEQILKSGIIATSSIRRKAQWLHRYPLHQLENLRGNVNTRMQKVRNSNWDGAIFAAAGLERIGLRPENAIELDWMLPAPAQGAIIVVARSEDQQIKQACTPFNHPETDLCTQLERDFLHELKGGCSTPVSALANIKSGILYFQANICSIDGKKLFEIKTENDINDRQIKEVGIFAARQMLQDPNIQETIKDIRNGK